MTDQLTKAIDNVCRVTFENDPWTKDDLRSWRGTSVGDIATILQAVASGELIPLADHKLAVAEAYQCAAEIRVPGIVGMASLRPFAKAAILALADTDALAELQAMRAERDATVKDAAEWATIAADNSDRAAAAEAKVARLVEALRPFANIGIGTDPDYEPMIRMDRSAIVSARAALSDIKGAKP